MGRYRLINTSLDRGYRNDLNANFDQISLEIDGVGTKIDQVETDLNATVENLVGGGFIDGLNAARDNANDAATTANSKAAYANTQGDYAKQQGDYAKDQGDYAKLKGDYANEKAVLADAAAANANAEASNLDGLKIAVVDATQAANTAATKADTAASNADTKAGLADTAAINADTATTNANDATDAINLVLPNVQGLENKKAYDPATSYIKNNIVQYNGSSYQALVDTTGNTPTDVAYWSLLAQRGVDGSGSVSSVDGMSPDLTGNVTTHLNKDVLDKLSDSAGKLEYNGQAIGTVLSVNGQVGNVAGLETEIGAQSKADASESNANTYTDSQIALIPPVDLTPIEQDIQVVSDALTTHMAKSEKVFKPETYGAVGDGATDDYQALRDMVDAVNLNGGGRVVLADAKKYYIGKYKIKGGTNQNAITDLAFKSLNHVSVEGNGSKITCKGDMHFSHDYDANGFKYTYVETVVPMAFVNCKNVTVNNLELDGQVNLSTKDADVVEGKCYGFEFSGCENVCLSNLKAHHFAADGFIFFAGADTIKDENGKLYINKNVVANNCIAEYNARQGITIGHIRGGVFTNCRFNYTGITGGTYGNHMPMCGIDFEMDYPESYVEDTTGDVVFVNCDLIGNKRSFSFVEDKIDNVKFINSRFESLENSTFGMIIQGKQLSFDSCFFNTPNDKIILDFDTNNNNYEIRNCYFEGGELIGTKTSSDNLSNILLKNNRFKNVRIFFDSMRDLDFMYNDVFYTADYYSTTGPAFVFKTYLQRIQLSKGNKFYTNLVATSSNEHFATVYTGTKRVDNDEYPTNAFRPNYNYASLKKYFSMGESAVSLKSPDGSTFTLNVDNNGTISASKMIYLE